MQRRYNILQRSLHFLLVVNVTDIGAHVFSCPLSLQRWKKRSHRGRIEEEIRPSPDRMRIDRWKIRIEEEMDEINVYARKYICNVDKIYTTNVFTRSMYTCKYYINQCLVPW